MAALGGRRLQGGLQRRGGRLDVVGVVDRDREVAELVGAAGAATRFIPSSSGFTSSTS